jgi:hypothetical protein
MSGSINYTALASGALSFTLALAWNDAVVKTIQSFFPPKDERAAAKATIVYAIVVTLLIVFVVALINGTRRMVHKFTGGDAKKGYDKSRAEGFRDAQEEDCASCAKRCGLSTPIVRLWQPSC